MSKIGIFGAGWVGVVTAACFAELGHTAVELLSCERAGRRDDRHASARSERPRLAQVLQRNLVISSAIA